MHTEYGLLDGKKQTTFDVIKSGTNKGKSNETTPLEQAMLVMQRKIIKQREEGYNDCIEQAADNTTKTIDWSKTLPKELCFFKPKTSCAENKLSDLEAKDQVILSIKRDGLCHIVRQTERGPEIYSRRMDLCSEKFPHLMDVFKGLPEKTILLGEVIFDKDGKDDFKTCCSICRSDAALAIEKQDRIGKVKYYVFDIAFKDGKSLLTTTIFEKRREIMLGVVSRLNSKYVLPSEVISKKSKDALKEVIQRGLEGLVINTKSGIMKENEAFSFNGKSERPNCIFKLKPKYEMDVIARFDPDNGIGEWGSGKNKGKMKSVFLYQLDNSGKEHFISKCGSGFDDISREKWTSTDLYPAVFEVEFDSIISGTGALRFPVFVRHRPDKNIDECILDARIKEALGEENLDEDIE